MRSMARELLGTAIALVVASAFAAAPVSAAESCKANFDRSTGAIHVDASNLGTPRWGTEASVIEAPFANEADCYDNARRRMRDCLLHDADSTDPAVARAARQPPPDCVIYVDDSVGSGPVCAAVIKNCVPQTQYIGTDGVVLIDQSRAIAGGVTPVDTPGFPVSINRPGSYRLTSNLDVSAEASPGDVTAVSINASHVTLDLNGFVIGGAATCSGTPVTSCTSTGTGKGIDATNGARVTIRNGTVRGMGNDGIRVTAGCNRIEGVDLSENAGAGVRGPSAADVSCVFDGVNANRNGDSGITCVGPCTVSASQVSGNKSLGIDAQGRANITNTVADKNGGRGIDTGDGSQVRSNVARYNLQDGISAGAGSTIAGNTSLGNSVFGIATVCPTNIVGNTATGNGTNLVYVTITDPCNVSDNVTP